MFPLVLLVFISCLVGPIFLATVPSYSGPYDPSYASEIECRKTLDMCTGYHKCMRNCAEPIKQITNKCTKEAVEKLFDCVINRSQPE